MTLRSPESPYTLFSLSETPSIHKTLLSPLKKTPTESAQSPPIYKHQNSPGSMSYRTPSLPALCTLEKPPVPCMKPTPRGPQSLCWPRLPENSLFFKSNNFPPLGESPNLETPHSRTPGSSNSREYIYRYIPNSQCLQILQSLENPKFLIPRTPPTQVTESSNPQGIPNLRPQSQTQETPNHKVLRTGRKEPVAKRTSQASRTSQT